MGKSLFIISLDFELFWGVRDKRTIENYRENLQGVRQVIPSLLRLFNRYGIHSTFATVGFLFAQNKEQLLKYRPAVLPDYTLKKYSPYEADYLDRVGFSEEDDIYHFAGSLIDMIKQYPEQEIASHTFSHYYCLEKASIESFEADMNAAKHIALENGIDVKTVVFPRNQYTPEHIAVCKKLGFIAYRGNEDSALYAPRQNDEQSKVIRATRLADAYWNVTGHHCFTIKQADIINIPASRFLRPCSSKLKALERMRLNRIKTGMTHAAKNSQAYHLWWHPHNFGMHLQENLSFLEEILKHYQLLHNQFGMQSKTMRAIAEETLQLYAV